MNTKLLRQQILDLAIRGKLVKQDPNDEPASALLERIRAEKEQLIQQGKIKKTKASAHTNTPDCENVPFDIPDSWEWVRVKDIFLLNPKNNVDDNVEVGFIPMECVNDGYSGEHFFYTKRWKDVKKGYTHFQNGDIGIAKISPCFENRKSTIFHNLPNGYGAGTTELTVLRSLSINAQYYLYVFKSAWYVSEGSKNFKGNVGQQRVSKDIFTNLFIPLPPLAEQQRIVTEIEKWFALIDELEANKQDLQSAVKQVRAKVLDLAIHGKLVPQDLTDEPAIDLLHRINPHYTPSDTSHYENIPQGWEVCRLLDICKIDTGKWDANHAVVDGQYRFYTCASQFAYCNTKRFTGECIIIPGNGDIGAVYYYAGDFDAYQRTYVLNNIQIFPKYLYYHLLSNWRQINSNRKFGSTIKFVRIGNFQNYTILLPPMEEQKHIVNAIDTFFEIIDTISAEL